MTDLTYDQRVDLAVHSPNLLCVLEREPPAEVEETRKRAREEVADLLKDLRKLRPISVRASERVVSKLAIELSRVEAMHLFNEIGDMPKTFAGPRLRLLYSQIESWLGIWADDDAEKKRRRR